MEQTVWDAQKIYELLRAVEHQGMRRGILIGIAGTILAKRFVRLPEIDVDLPWTNRKK